VRLKATTIAKESQGVAWYGLLQCVLFSTRKRRCDGTYQCLGRIKGE
jgi:hypothetical protein